MASENTLALKIERFYLRPVEKGDLELLFDLDSDPEVMRFISKGRPTPRERIEQDHLPRMMSYYRRWPPLGFWAAHLHSTDEFIGWFHLRPDKIEPNEMELGYRLKRSVWGRGLATEGSRWLLDHAFSDWGYDRVCARTLAVNMGSRRVMEKCGLRFEREFFWSAEVLPEWSEEERRGVKYSAQRRAS